VHLPIRVANLGMSRNFSDELRVTSLSSAKKISLNLGCLEIIVNL
jgi:hypothetical protein